MVMVKEAQAKYLTNGKEEQAVLEKGACPDGYKLSEVGVIPEEWEIKQLCKVATLQRGFDLPTKILKKGKYPVVYSNGISNYHEKYMVKGIGVITGRSGTIGKVHYVEENYWPHNTSLWVTNFHGNNEKFIYYLYNSLKLERFCTGSGVPTLNRNDVHDLTVVLPSVKEQVLIAKALSDVDALITSLEKLIAKKQAIKTATMQQLLTGKKRLPGFGEGKGYKQTGLGEAPEDWIMPKLGDLFEFKNGLNKEKEYFGYGTPIINYMDVYSFSGLINKHVGGKVSVTSNEIRTYSVKKGDVFFTRTSETVNEIGCTSVLLENIQDAVFSGFVLRARPKNNVLDLQFKNYCFLSSIVRKQIMSTSSYTTRALTNGRLLSVVVLPCPKSIEEQSAIANVLLDMDKSIKQLQTRLAKTQQIKQGMMQELLTGKTRLI